MGAQAQASPSATGKVDEGAGGGEQGCAGGQGTRRMDQWRGQGVQSSGVGDAHHGQHGRGLVEQARATRAVGPNRTDVHGVSFLCF